MFNSCPSKSPVAQDYIWLAEYYKGSFAEFDFETLKQNSFYDIKKDKLVRFGLIGRNSKLWFECSRGVFNLFGNRVNISYKVGNKRYDLTKQNVYQRDIITYKKAFAETTLMGKKSETVQSNILSYSFGYKTILKIDDAVFNFKPIVTIPQDENKQPYITINLSCDRDMKGSLEISAGDKTISWNAPLKKDVSGELSWNF